MDNKKFNFDEFAAENQLTPSTITILKANDFNILSALIMLSESEMKRLGISRGQQLTLTQAIENLTTITDLVVKKEELKNQHMENKRKDICGSQKRNYKG